MTDSLNSIPCPKCGQSIPDNVSVCHHCGRHLGFWGFLTNTSVLIGVLAAVVSVYGGIQTSSDKKDVEAALKKSQTALESIKKENTLRSKEYISQRWDIYRSRYSARVNGCKSNTVDCDYLMSQEVQDFYFFISVLEQKSHVLRPEELKEYCVPALLTINRRSESTPPLSVKALRTFPSLTPRIENLCKNT